MLGENRQKKGSGIVIADSGVSGRVSLIAGVDAGSTQTRVCLADASDVEVFMDANRMGDALKAIQTQYVVPSTYASVDSGREIAPVSPNLEDNYDSTVVLISNTAEKPLVSRHRVLRGRKIQDAMGVTPRYLDSSTNKTDNIIFYINIIDAIGYAILQKYNGHLPADVDLGLVVSVRPKELVSVCKERMQHNLIGEYMFAWNGVTIHLHIKALDFTTEPEAQILGTTTVYDLRANNDIDKERNLSMADKLSYSDCFLHIEGGGSSIGVEVLRDGIIQDACSSTFALGGNYMAQVFIDRYRELQGRTVTKEAANNAIVTCTLRDGRSLLDVSELVSHCMDQVAMGIAERLRHEVIDTMSDLTLQDVEFITLGGRLFSNNKEGHSIGTFFTDYIHQISPNTEVYCLAENFIAQGNMVTGINSEEIASVLSQQIPSIASTPAVTPTPVVTSEPTLEEVSTVTSDTDEE